MARVQGPRYYTTSKSAARFVSVGGYVLTAAGRTVGEMIEERAEELLPGERLMLIGGGG